MKKITTILTVAALATGMAVSVYAEETKEVTVAVEKLTLGSGFILEPTLVTLNENESASEGIVKALSNAGIGYDGYLTDGVVSYYTAVGDTETDVNIPTAIKAAIESAGGSVNYTRNREGFLSENDYYQGAWMYLVNNQSPWVGANEYIPQDGDVIQLYYTVYGWGADYGFGWSGNVEGVEYADRTELLKTVAKAKNEFSQTNEYATAMEVLSAYGASQESVDNAAEKLALLGDEVKQAYVKGGEYLLSLTPSFGSEWNVLGLARNGAISKEYKDTYYSSVSAKIEETDGAIGSSATDYARATIGLTAIGKDAENIKGYNLIDKITEEAVEKQGVNAAVYALIALDTAGYESENISREYLVGEILSKELENGGWTFWGSEPDPDMTSMALTALAPYYDTNEEVKTAVDTALVWLSETQCESGAYSSWGSENPESTAQVLTALTALGIDPDTDERFIKNGITIPEAITEYAVADGGYAHTMGGKVNLSATQQAYYALTAYYRFENEQTSLYDMSDLQADISVSKENATVTYVNGGSRTANALCVSAQYDADGRLTKTQTAEVVIETGESYQYEIAQGEVIYLWNVMKPWCDVVRN